MQDLVLAMQICWKFGDSLASIDALSKDILLLPNLEKANSILKATPSM